METSTAMKIVQEMDSFPYMQHGLNQYKQFMRQYYCLYVKGFPKPIGYVHHSVIVEMPWNDRWSYDSTDNSLIFNGGTDIEKRNEEMRQTLFTASMKARNQKDDDMPLSPIRCLSYNRTTVYAHDGQQIMDIDKAATELLGLPRYSVALTAWTDVDGRRQYWVPQRSFKNANSPGKFDNMGSISLGSGETPFELIREIAVKQAGLPTGYANTNLRACGTISYQTLKHKTPFVATVQPHVQYVYEIELDKDRKPTANPAIKALRPMYFDELWCLLGSSEFEPHAQMTYLAHFVRRGYVNAENEPKLQEVQTRLHRRIEFIDIQSSL